MDKLTHQDFYELLEYTHPHCISLYMQTQQVSAESKQNQIRFRDMVDKTVTELAQSNLDEHSRRMIFESLNRLLADENFWRHQSKSFCLFVSPEMERWYRLPIEVKPLAMVSTRFHLKQLVPLVTKSYDFYLLTLSQKSVKLFKGDMYDLHQVEVPDMPSSMQEALKLEIEERQLQFHTSTDPGGSGTRPAMFHGSGTWKDEKQKKLSRFIQRVEHPLEVFLRNQKVPLLFAGVKYLCPLFAQVNRYPYFITDSMVHGNTEHWTLDRLHKEAVKALEPDFDKQELQALEKYNDRAGSTIVSADLTEILREATLGKVDTLFVAKGVREWGTFDPDTLQVQFDGVRHSSNTYDLLDLACAQTLMTGGKAFVLPPDKVPSGNHIAAVLRY